MGANAGGHPSQQPDYYPSSNAFPPPPTNEYEARNAGYPPGEYPQGEYPPYNPADYPPPPGATPQPGMYEQYPLSPDPNLGYPPVNETYAGDPHYEGGHAAGRAGPEHVSPSYGPGTPDDPHGACSLSVCPW